jgi:hypothetical protein
MPLHRGEDVYLQGQNDEARRAQIAQMFDNEVRRTAQVQDDNKADGVMEV